MLGSRGPALASSSNTYASVGQRCEMGAALIRTPGDWDEGLMERKLGQLDRLVTELPENAAPIIPVRWGDLSAATISFGHGLSVAPLQALQLFLAVQVVDEADAGHADDGDQLGVAGGVHQLGDVLGDSLKLPVVDLEELEPAFAELRALLEHAVIGRVQNEVVVLGLEPGVIDLREILWIGLC